MMTGATLDLITIGMGVLIALLGIPMVLGKVKPNNIYGFRTRKTLSDPDIWYPANRAAGFAMLVAGMFLIVAGGALALLWTAPEIEIRSWVHIGLWAIATGGMVIYSFTFLRRLR